MEEIAVLELKQKRLISMLSQIDPVVYLQKLQQELVALQVKTHFERSVGLIWNGFNVLLSAGDKQEAETD